MVCVSKTCFSLLRYCEKVALRIIITPALASALLQTLANQGIVGLAPKACVPYIELATKAIVLAPREIRTPPKLYTVHLGFLTRYNPNHSTLEQPAEAFCFFEKARSGLFASRQVNEARLPDTNSRPRFDRFWLPTGRFWRDTPPARHIYGGARVLSPLGLVGNPSTRSGRCQNILCSVFIHFFLLPITDLEPHSSSLLTCGATLPYATWTSTSIR